MKKFLEVKKMITREDVREQLSREPSMELSPFWEEGDKSARYYLHLVQDEAVGGYRVKTRSDGPICPEDNMVTVSFRVSDFFDPEDEALIEKIYEAEENAVLHFPAVVEALYEKALVYGDAAECRVKD